MAFDMRNGEASYIHHLQKQFRRGLFSFAETNNKSRWERRAGERERRERETRTVLAAESMNGVNKATVEIGRPSQARHLWSYVLPHAITPPITIAAATTHWSTVQKRKHSTLTIYKKEHTWDFWYSPLQTNFNREGTKRGISCPFSAKHTFD